MNIGMEKRKILRRNLPASHLHLMLKGGQTVSTSIAALGVDLNVSIIERKQVDCRLFNFFQCDGEAEFDMKKPYLSLARMTNL